MDPSACRVIYIDERFNTERWISRDGLSPSTPARTGSQIEFSDLPPDLQTNVNAFLTVFNQVYVCSSGRAFSSKLSELHDTVRLDCTPILACFDVGSETRHESLRSRPKFFPSADSPLPSPGLLRKEITFSSESDESYGLQLVSRIASDLQVEEGSKLIIPVAIVQPKRSDSYDQALDSLRQPEVIRAPFGSDSNPVAIEDTSDVIDTQLMLQCLDAGALDVVKSPLDKAGIMGLTVHAYRIYKNAKKEQAGFMAMGRRNRKQSWVGMEDEKPYAYLREAMVKKLLKGICEPQNIIEDYQHRSLFVQESRKGAVAAAVGRWDFSAHDFTEDELVYAGYYMLNHCLEMEACEQWSMSQRELLHFMQGCRVAYNSFVLYHNFRHAVDVLQSVFYFLLQIGTLPPYPAGSKPSPFADKKSPVARLLGPFEGLTLLVSAIGHDVGHPGVNNMFLVKLNAPLAQLYNDQSVLEAFHCAAYSQILRRHWPVAFQDKAIRKLMISTILATDMGVHSDYMQQLGNLQEKIHESQATDGWSPKDVDWARTLACGLVIKCADISNVARPWLVAEKWTHLLQQEFANQGEMEQAVGLETTLFGGPPELGNMLKLANGQIGFMTIFAHPLFANVADIIPAMRFAADEILTNKGVWFTRAEHEKKLQLIKKGTGPGDGGSISPRTQSPAGRLPEPGKEKHLTSSPLRGKGELPDQFYPASGRSQESGSTTPQNGSRDSSLAAVAAIMVPGIETSTHRGSGSRSSQDLRATNRGRSGSALVNGEHIPLGLTLDGSPIEENDGPTSSSTPGLAPSSSDLSSESLTTQNDTRRDNMISMRAGAETIPSEVMKQSRETDAEALQKFKFATSDENEPVRTFDPQKEYSPAHPNVRASAPASDIESSQAGMEDPKQLRSVESESAASTKLRGGGGDEALTLSGSATSYASEKSEDTSRHQNSFQAARNRAASAPMHSANTTVRPSYSMASNSTTSREGSKYDVHTTILSNGVMEEGSNKERKASTKSVGRRRSKLKLGLAFWKRNRNDKSVEANGERPTSQESGGG